MNKIILWGAMLVLLSGCGLYGTYKKKTYDFERQAFGVTAIESDSSFKAPSWRLFFSDPNLLVLIEQALKNNSDLQNAELQVEEAQAAFKAARFYFLPTFSVVPNVGYNANYLKSDFTYQIPVQASWQLDFFGQLRNGKKQQKEILRATEAYKQAVQAELISTVAATYYALVGMDAKRKIYTSTATIWAENIEVVKAMMDAGMYNNAAVSQTEADYYMVQNYLIDIENDIAKTENILCRLLCITPQHIQRSTIDAYVAPKMVKIGVPLSVLDARPDVKQAEFNLASAYYATNASRGAFFPNIVITGGFDFAEMIAGAIGSLTQPIWQHGAIVAKYKISKAQQQQAENMFRQTLINAGIEVNDACRSVKISQIKAENCGKRVESLQTATESTKLLMKHGSVTYLEVLNAHQNLLTAQIEQLTNQLNEITNTILLYKAIGGGLE